MTTANRNTDAKLDKFYSPQWAIRLLIDWWDAHGVLDDENVVMEPCCGGGAICEAVHERGLAVDASDIVPDKNAVERWNASKRDARRFCEWFPHLDNARIITNPPYSAETGTAGDVLSAIVPSRLPTAALVRLPFLEACNDRANLLCGKFSPSEVHILPRVQYDGPDGGDDDNPMTSVWVCWNTESFYEKCVGHDTCVHTELGGSAGFVRIVPKWQRDHFKGQESLFSVKEMG